MLRRLILLLLLCCLAASAEAAQASRAPRPQPQPFQVQSDAWASELNAARTQIGWPNLRSEDLDRAGRAVEQVRQAAAQARDEEHGKAESVRALLATLGPKPEAGQPPETPDIAAKRKELEADLARYSGRVKQAELTLAQADEVARAITQARQTRFANRLFRRGPSPLSPAVWAEAVPEAAHDLARLAAAPLERWRVAGAEDVASRQRDLVLALAALIAGIAIGWPVRRTLIGRFGRDPAIAQPEFGRRALAAAAGGIARGLIPALAIAALALTLWVGDPSSLFAAMVQALATAALSIILVTTLAWAALAPDAPAWRLLPVDADAARLIYRRIVLAICVSAVNILFFGVARKLGASSDLRALLPGIVDTVLAVVLLSLLPSRLWRPAPPPASADAQLPEPEDAAHLSPDAAPARPAAPPAGPAPQPAVLGGRWWLLSRILAGAVAVSVPFWAAFGYVRFATYLNNALLSTAAAIGLLLMLRLLSGEALRRLVGEPVPEGVPESRSATPPPPAALQRWLALDEQSARYVEFWLSLFVDLALIAIGLITMALILGVRTVDLAAALSDIFAGVTIGKIRLSPSDIGVGLILFVVALGVTRLIQRFLDERVLARTRVDSGVRNSLVAGIGYLGFFIAALIGISATGLDLSNLAIIAGALSLGIGFGLQNIVNNFVSGLILLVERPIKVGDAVSVNGRDGVVRRISVRATEIETAQRASIIIPNSELLSSAVTNMTHRDTLGRVDIVIGVAYGSDTEKVRKMLLDCAQADYRVLRHPAPQVLFRDFADSALKFELRCFVGAPADGLWVPSDLRFAIDKACREQGIEMPFPQREIRIRDVQSLAAALPGARPHAAGE